MSLPLGKSNTTCPNSRPSPNGSYDPFENTPIMSGRAGPRRLSQSGAPLASNAHLTPAAPHTSSSHSGFLFPEPLADELSARTSPNSSAMNSPLPSRSSSPLPAFYSSAPSSASDTDSDEPGSPLLLGTYPTSYVREGRPRWWNVRQRPRRVPRRSAGWGHRSLVRVLRRVFRHPFVPKHPSTIVRLSLIFPSSAPL
jgi:hypothetical protein